MSRILQLCIPAVLLLNLYPEGLAAIRIVSSQNEFRSAQNASSTGDTIVWKAGLYYHVDLLVTKSHLVIMAEVPGKTVFTGASKARFSGSYITFSGFQYLNGNIGTSNVIEITGSHNHLTQMNIQGYYCNKYVIIQEGCEYNQLSYCNLEQRAFIGNENILSILVSSNKPGYHSIRYCSFKDFEGTGGDMGTEPIRIGLSTQGEFISRSVVEYCYFTQCNGDGEIISNKSRQNVYRYNTFEDNPKGELVLRHGDEGVVYGNFFLDGMGGVRIKEGQHHVVFNNYFSGLTGRAINLQNYSVDPLDDITIAFNTIVNCAEVRMGGAGSDPPTRVTFANNIFADPAGKLFSDPTGQEIWLGNLSSGALGIPRPEGIREADPGLERNSDGFYGLASGSTAIDSAQAGYPLLPDYPGLEIDHGIILDLMQQTRPSEIALKDIGCSEYPQQIVIKPYATEENTGPSYLHDQDFVILKLTRDGEGSVVPDPPSGVYDSGTVVTLSATPSTYSFFRQWGGDLEGSENPATLVMDGHKNVTAYFESFPLSDIEIYIAGSGLVEVDPPGWRYPDSTWITLTAIPDSGYLFSHWSGHLTGTDNPYLLLVTGPVVSFANFIPQSPNSAWNPAGSVYGPPEVYLYPNPAQGSLFISCSHEQWRNMQLSLCDQNGAVIKCERSLPGPGNMVETDISGLSAGLYFVMIQIDAGNPGKGPADQYTVWRKFLKL